MVATRRRVKQAVEAPIDFYAVLFAFTAGSAVLIIAPDWALQAGQSLANRIPGVKLDLAPKSATAHQPAARRQGKLDDNAMFELGLKQVMKWETTKCSNVVGDGGGLTCRGVTNATYQSWLKSKGKPSVPVSNITEAEAREIYRNMYWEPSGAGKLPLKLAMIAFDVAVNSPMHRVPEIIGKPQTDVDAWAKAALDRREVYYKEVAGKGDQQKFVAGWLNRNNDLRKFVASLNDAPAAPATPGKPGSTSTFGLYSGLELGTGVCVAPDLVLTAHHVVSSGNIKMRVPQGSGMQSVAVKLVKSDPAHDLALVQIPMPCQPIPLGEMPKVGDPLVMTGNSGNTLKSVTGKVLSIGETLDYTPEGKKGDSGGPVLVGGKLVGITSRAGSGRTLAVKTNTLRRFLN
ncbi:MAG: glycosyl hydrolase 108 family protein [Stenomitos frigidus ULC029]